MKTSAAVLVLALPALVAAEAAPARQRGRDGRVKGAGSADALDRVLERYAREFLKRHPVVSTYLGGSGLFPELASADGTLRDWSSAARAQEKRLWKQLQGELQAIAPTRLQPRQRVDREVALHQLAFLLHQDEERAYWQRSLDTYVNEAFRGIDWYLQGMGEIAPGRYGTEREWRTAAARVGAVPAYLRTARANLESGLAAGTPRHGAKRRGRVEAERSEANLPDWRMVERDGIASAEANARYFGVTLPEVAAERTAGQPFSPAVLAELRQNGEAAAAAFRDFGRFLQEKLATLPKQDRYALGEKEYDWALRNNLHVPFTAADLFERSWPIVQETRKQLMAVARRVAESRKLPFDGDADPAAATLKVIEVLSQDYPKSDADMVRWYHETALRLVEYGRRTNLFDIPADYKLEVTATPPTLESSIDGAAYYPAPPFRPGGVGRFYVTAPHEDVEKLKQNNRASLADLAAHEGFPGHDWHYKVMTRYREQISPVRWLTPGEVEGSGSMWEDSMAAEGWALYAEHLMGEAAPGAPDGFYTPEERIYQLQGQLYRDLRVRIDTGLHTGRMSFDEAVDLFSEIVDFLPGSCRGKDLTPAKKASCDSSWRAIFRYSKWPTQAITYRLGKMQILALREKADALMPGSEGRRRFHLLFMQQGTIPAGYFEEELLAAMKR